MSINRVSISGNLTRDAELRTTPSGTSVLTFGVAVNDRRKNQTTGEWEDKPNFIDCTMFGIRAQSLAQHLVKGTKVAVDGKLDHQSWKAPDGSARSKVQVVVNDIDFMAPRAQQTPQQVINQAYPQAIYTDAYAMEDIPF